MADNDAPEVPAPEVTVVPDPPAEDASAAADELKVKLDEYMQVRNIDGDDLTLEEDLLLARQEAEDAAEVERVAREQELGRKSPEELADLRQRWFDVAQASAANDGDSTARTSAPTYTPTYTVIVGGKAGKADEPEVLPALGPLPSYPPPVELEEKYKRTWPLVVEPRSLFDLKLQPDMYPTGAGSFFDWYFGLIEPTTDAPRPFHLATAICMIATAMGPRWTIQHRGALSPALWFMVIADSGARKSTAMKMLRQFVGDEKCIIGIPESTAAFMQNLFSVDENNACWWIDEASGFIDMFTKTWTADLQTKLTSAFNGDAITYTTKAHTIQINRPHLSILTGAPLSWLREKRLSMDFIRGGIFSRFLLVPASRKEHKPFPPPIDESGARQATAYLKALSTMKGRKLTLSHEALQEYLSWDVGRGEFADLAVTGLWNRCGDHVLKLALVYHVAAGRSSAAEVQPDSVRQAVNFMQNYLLPGHLWATRRLCEASVTKRSLTAIEELVESSPMGVMYNEMPSLLALTHDTLYRLLYALFTAQRIQFWRWRPTTDGRERYFLVTKHGVKPHGRTGYLDDQRLPPGLAKWEQKYGEVPEPEVEEDIHAYFGTWSETDD